MNTCMKSSNFMKLIQCCVHNESITVTVQTQSKYKGATKLEKPSYVFFAASPPTENQRTKKNRLWRCIIIKISNSVTFTITNMWVFIYLHNLQMQFTFIIRMSFALDTCLFVSSISSNCLSIALTNLLTWVRCFHSCYHVCVPFANLSSSIRLYIFLILYLRNNERCFHSYGIRHATHFWYIFPCVCDCSHIQMFSVSSASTKYLQNRWRKSFLSKSRLLQ